MSQVHVVNDTSEHLVAVCDAITFCVWKQSVSAAGLADCRTAYRLASQQGQRDAGIFGIISPACAPPSGSAPAEIIKDWKNPEFRICVIGAIVIGQGILNTAKRLAASGYSMMNPTFRLFHSLEAGSEHVSSRLSSMSSGQILTAANECLVRCNLAPSHAAHGAV